MCGYDIIITGYLHVYSKRFGLHINLNNCLYSDLLRPHRRKVEIFRQLAVCPGFGFPGRSSLGIGRSTFLPPEQKWQSKKRKKGPELWHRYSNTYFFFTARATALQILENSYVGAVIAPPLQGYKLCQAIALTKILPRYKLGIIIPSLLYPGNNRTRTSHPFSSVPAFLLCRCYLAQQKNLTLAWCRGGIRSANTKKSQTDIWQVVGDSRIAPLPLAMVGLPLASSRS